jgi:hypothetical protein
MVCKQKSAKIFAVASSVNRVFNTVLSSRRGGRGAADSLVIPQSRRMRRHFGDVRMDFLRLDSSRFGGHGGNGSLVGTGIAALERELRRRMTTLTEDR